jgi:cysteine desulfurase
MNYYSYSATGDIPNPTNGFFYQPRQYAPVASVVREGGGTQNRHVNNGRASNRGWTTGVGVVALTGPAVPASTGSRGSSAMCYFDNAASTSILPEVLEAMIPMFTENYGNPEASHHAGKLARDIMEDCREQIANAFEVEANEIYFTSGASESVNTFIRGVAQSNCDRKRRKLVMSAIEHKAVSATCLNLEKEGYDVVIVPVTAGGIIDLRALTNAVDQNTLLVCVIMANNEVGVLQPIEQVARIAHANGALLFSDTTQIAGKLTIHPKKLGIDALCISGHKIHGPKGVGALYMSSNIECAPIMTGGHQERGQRAGTSNTPGIAGLAAAIRKNLSPQGQQLQRLVKQKKDWVETELVHGLPEGCVTVHCAESPRINTVSSIGVVDASGNPIDKAEMMRYLNANNIVVSAGSACNAGSDRSDVLEAIGVTPNMESCTLRISLSALTTWPECQQLVNAIKNRVVQYE